MDKKEQPVHTASPRQPTLDSVRMRTLGLSHRKAAPKVALGAIVILAAGLRFANLGAVGYANHYYAAAVASMLQSWRNFFFVAAEPGASVTVDKPPVGLWVQTVSSYFFGVSGFSVLLPQILAGILSVVLVHHLVRRRFGTGVGLAAALALAVTPVAVATDRNNTMDSTLILTLLDYLQANTQGIRYLMAAPSAMQGADYVLATGRPVLYVGGFMGRDRVASGEDLARLVAEGELRYIYWNGDGRGGPQTGQTDVSSWVSASCVAVPGFDTQTQNAGAPDGAAPGLFGGPNGGPGGPPGGPGNMRVTLYDCAGTKQ